jgi:hypothetical protein
MKALRGSLVAKLLAAQLLVVVAGALTLAFVALAVAPGLFHGHVRDALGVVPQDVSRHLDEAFQDSVLLSLAVAVAAALAAAGAVSAFLALRIVRPVRGLAALTSRLNRPRVRLDADPGELRSGRSQTKEHLHEFRASLIVGVLRLTSRLIMLALGPQAFRTILADYWSKVPPQMYGALEADAFAEYLERIDLGVPHLAKILEFERAVAATLVDDEVRIVHFDFEPIPLLRALAEGRLPDAPSEPGNFEIELTAEGPAGIGGLDFEEVQQAFPFH